MSGSINKVMLMGRLGKDPEERRMATGDVVVSMSLATSESWKDKETGERKEKTEWHKVVIFDQAIAKIASGFLRKGSRALVEGQLQTRKWTDKDGLDHYSTEIVLQRFRGNLILMDPKQQGEEKAPKHIKWAEDLDDEVPF